MVPDHQRRHRDPGSLVHPVPVQNPGRNAASTGVLWGDRAAAHIAPRAQGLRLETLHELPGPYQLAQWARGGEQSDHPLRRRSTPVRRRARLPPPSDRRRRRDRVGRSAGLGHARLRSPVRGRTVTRRGLRGRATAATAAAVCAAARHLCGGRGRLGGGHRSLEAGSVVFCRADGCRLSRQGGVRGSAGCEPAASLCSSQPPEERGCGRLWCSATQSRSRRETYRATRACR